MTYAYEHVRGLFELSSWDEDIEKSFGLVGDWERFAQHIEDMKEAAQPDEVVKVIYTARHGEAEHNILARKYGLPDGDAVQQLYPIVDPALTPDGRAQALRLNSIFQREAARGMPLPSRWFVSPMRRPGETCGLEWGWVFGQDATADGEPSMNGCVKVNGCANGCANGSAKLKGSANGCLSNCATGLEKGCSKQEMSWGVPAECVEELREHLHVNQCDKRLPLSQLRRLFPTFMFPDSMTEEDTIWQPTGRETEAEMVARAGRGLAIVMQLSGDDTYISVTSHSGFLRAVYKNLGVPARRLVTGEMNVLVVKARRG